jgi:hypothetical protein
VLFRGCRARAARLLVLLSSLGVTAGCSKALNWDPSGLPCDTNVRDGFTYFCSAGHSCETASVKCLRDGSVSTGNLCTLSRQCVAGNVCPVDMLAGGGVRDTDHVLSCWPGCNATSSSGPEPYLSSDGCASNARACLPYLDQLASNTNKTLLGACVPSSPCKEGGACALNSNTTGVCVQVTASATACLQGCQITWNGTTYGDNCGGSSACQPVGLGGHQQFVCTYNGQATSATPLAGVSGIAVAGQGAACAPVSKPCQDGNVCVPGKNTCAQYCQITTNATSTCPTNQTCCPFTTFASPPSTAGFCATSCN